MSQIMIDRYRRWFDYEKDSHAGTLASLAAVPAESAEAKEFGKAVYLMGHIVAARRMWLFRLGIAKENAELFPGAVTLDEIAGQLSEMEKLWSEYLSGLDDRC